MGALDIEMFGEAFQFGATWGCHNFCNEHRNEQFDPSWFLYAINSANSQTLSVIPAAIAGVTRSDECTRQKL